MPARPPESHPLLRSGALEQLLLRLEALAPLQVLSELAPWLQSLADMTLAPEWRARLLCTLDDAADRATRACAGLYLAACHSAADAGQSVWRPVHQHWLLLQQAAQALLPPGHAHAEPAWLARICVLALHAGGERARWEAFVHGPSTDEVWSSLNQAYAAAVHGGVARTHCTRGDLLAAATSAELEYLRAVALHSLGPDQFDPLDIELGARLIDRVLPWLEFSPSPMLSVQTWVDVARDAPPARLLHTPRDSVLPRYFNATPAIARLQQLLDLDSLGQLPPELLQGTTASGAARVLSHMIRVWSDEAPLRRERRHTMPARMQVVSGFAEVLAVLQGRPPGWRHWQVRDASLHGLGVEMSADQGADLPLGSLLALRPDDGTCWRLGVMRRRWYAQAGQLQCGVELFSGRLDVVRVDDGAQRCEVLLLDPLQHGAPLRLILPLRLGMSPRPLFVFEASTPVRLQPLPGQECGPDYLLRSFHVPA